MLQALLYQLIETNRIDEEGTVYSINSLYRYACIVQNLFVDAVARDRVLVLGFEDHSWNIEMLSIL